jgi:neutral trehalase
MAPLEAKTEFIRMRAEGKSYRKIAEALHISRSTCGEWEQEFKEDIARMKQDQLNDLYEAYNPMKEGKATMEGNPDFPRKRYILTTALSTIALMIENVIGLSISLPRKTVDWTIPNLEKMGIENLSLKRNLITILSNNSNRGWEIQMESEKLYYFTINILNQQKKKTLPIPSGKCSMLIDKL